MRATKVSNTASFKMKCGGVAHLKRVGVGWKVNKFSPSGSGRGASSFKADNLPLPFLAKITTEARNRGYQVRT